MSSELSVFSGWLGGRSVADFVQEHALVIVRIPIAVVTMVDSCPAVREMPWATRWPDEGVPSRSAASPMIISTSTLVEIVESGDVFYGFDEVWFCESGEAVVAQPGLLTAPRRLDQTPLNEVEAVAAAGIVLGLGDGYGLNFVVTQRALAVDLRLMLIAA